MEPVYRIEGSDCWSTWYWEDCDRHGIFGVTLKHIKRITGGIRGLPAYDVGTRIYFEDAPFFRCSGKRVHVIHGPYIVVASELQPKSSVVHRTESGIIMLAKRRAFEGPWIDGLKRREFGGVIYDYPQCASYYEFFPFRLSIRRDSTFTTREEPHTEYCRHCRPAGILN